MGYFYEKEGVVRATLDLSDRSITVYWDSLANDEAIEDCCVAQLKQLQGQVSTIYMDVSDAIGVPTQKRQSWFVSELFPEFEKCGVKTIVVITPKSAITRLAIKKWVKAAFQFDFDMLLANNMDEARILVKRMAA